MPVISISMKELKKCGIGPDALRSLLPRMGIEVEEMSADEMKISVTPNRPDLLDLRGILRAIDHFEKSRMPKEGFYKISGKPAMTVEASPSVAKVRPYIAGIVVKGADLGGDCLKQFINFTEKLSETYGRKRRKLAIGVHSLGAIRGQLSYSAVGEGRLRPLGSGKEVSISEIMSEHEKGKAYGGAILQRGSVKVYPLLSDEEKAIALIPITNSEETRVTEKTRDLFIDVTGTSRKAVMEIAGIIACSFLYAGADVLPVAVKYPSEEIVTPALEYKEMLVDTRRIEKSIGVIIGESKIIGLANKMGYVAAKYNKYIKFYVPPYRIDVLSRQDIIEDIAIAYGYDNIIPVPIMDYADGASEPLVDFENRAASILVSLGYTEAVNSSLTNEELNFGMLNKKKEEYDYVKTANAQSAAITMLRTNLLHLLLSNLGQSKDEAMPQRMFEAGHVFGIKEGLSSESLHLSCATTHSKASFSEISAVFAEIMNGLDVKFELKPHSDSAFIDGRCAAAFADGHQVGLLGEIHPSVLSKAGINEPTAALEISLIEQIKYEIR